MLESEFNLKFEKKMLNFYQGSRISNVLKNLNLLENNWGSEPSLKTSLQVYAVFSINDVVTFSINTFKKKISLICICKAYIPPGVSFAQMQLK